MDEINTYIIKRLSENGRTPYLDIARKLKLSEGAVRKRVAKLSEEGIIRRFTIETRHNARAVVGISTAANVESRKVVASLHAMGVEKVYQITGRYDIMITLFADSMEGLNHLLEDIRAIDGVSHTETFTILKEN